MVCVKRINAGRDVRIAVDGLCICCLCECWELPPGDLLSQ